MYEELIMRLLEDKSWIEQGTTETEHEIADHLRKAADAIEKLSAEVLSDRAILKQYGGETGIKDLNEFTGKYWDTLAKIPRWISVTETLPETSGTYLAWMQWDLTDPDDNPSAYPIEYDAGEEAFGCWRSYFDPESLGWAGDEFIRYEGVTHWMPLPEPPKEET